MEVIKIIGTDCPGLFQRILVEFSRRKVNIDKVFMARSNGHVTIIIEADTGAMNGRLLNAMMALQDVNLAEYVKDDFLCFWESSKEKGSDYILACGADTNEKRKIIESAENIYMGADKAAKD